MDADAALPDDPEVLKRMIRELLAMLATRDRELEGVQRRLDQLLRRLYGPKSEAFRPDQPTLFAIPGEPEPATPPPASDAPVSPTSNPKPKRGHGRRRLPDDLPRERVVHDLPDAEKTCPCCRSPRVKMGDETSEQLDYRPASLFVREHVRLKYACTKCLQNREPKAGDITVSPIVVAPKPTQPIDGGLPGPGLLAHVVVSKFCDHLPLHRQESILARHGVELARSTMCDWVAAVANLLLPICLSMRSDILLSRVVQTDETRVPVQDPGSRKTKSGRLWVYIGDRNHPHIVYDYTPDKSRDGPAKVLKDYRGYLQADAANVFDGIYRPGGIVEVGCWAHARRYFHEARDSDPVRSAEALARIGAFYGIEDEAGEHAIKEKLEGDAADALRLQFRRERTLPKLREFAAWMEKESPRVLPKSPMGQAMAYAKRQWPALLRFAEAGYLALDNNASERALRAVALGRKNWLFAGSDAGGKTAAVLYSLVQTCKRHAVDPFAYLQDVLTRFPNAGSTAALDFSPSRWSATRPL